MNSPSTKRVKITVAVAALAAAAVLLLLQTDRRPAGPPKEDYYFDLGSGQIVKGPRGMLPISLPSGSQGVRAQVVSCGACTSAEWKVVSLSTYTPEAAAILAGPKPAENDPAGAAALNRAATEGQLIALPPKAGEQPRWIPFREYAAPASRDPVAIELRTLTTGLCGGKPATLCTP